MRKRLFLLFFVSLLFPLIARDFREPIAIIDPLFNLSESQEILFTDVFSELRYQQHLFQNAPTDDFDIGVIAGFTAFNYKNLFAVNAYYSNYNMMSPFAEGDNVVNIMRWWMSGFEIEYGLTGSVLVGPFHLLTEYSRTSQHPFLGTFSEVATDTLKGGILIPDLKIGQLELIPSIRYTDRRLYAFWESVLPDPDKFRMIDPELRLLYPIAQTLSFIGDYALELSEYTTSGWQWGGQAETGLRYTGTKMKVELFHEFYSSFDTEVLRHERAPVKLSGLGIRFSNQ